MVRENAHHRCYGLKCFPFQIHMLSPNSQIPQNVFGVGSSQGLEEWCRRDEWQQKGSSRCWSILPVVDTCTHTSDKLFGITYTVHMRYKTGKIRVKLKIYINNLMVTYCDLTDTGGSWSRCTRTYYFLQLYVSLDVWINFSLKIKNIQIKMRKHLGIQ